MSEEFSAKVRTLNGREIFDLVRAAMVLAVTVVLALVVPPQVFGADAPEQTPTKVESSR